jgi:hypothetical protein
MSAIIHYVKPMSQCINGLPRPEHHFWLDLPDHMDQMEVVQWINHAVIPHYRDYWPETYLDHHGNESVRFHVILRRDRDAALFKLRW